MNARALLDEIFNTKLVHEAGGTAYPLDSNVDREEGEFLAKLVQEYKPRSTIEIGCAFGISSLYICAELQKIGNARHTIIDGWQSTQFKNIGISNLQKAGIDFYELIEGISEIVLPQLLAQQKKFDFCFIDGNHTFDHTLLDFFYLNRMIEPGGIIVLDDTGFPAVNKVVRYILNYPAYKIIGHVPIRVSQKRRFFDAVIKGPARVAANFFPGKIRSEIFADKIISSDKKLHLQSSMIALQKVSNDERQWNWYEPF